MTVFNKMLMLILSALFGVVLLAGVIPTTKSGH